MPSTTIFSSSVIGAILVAASTATNTTRPSPPSCRILPGDPSWPTQEAWNAFNHSIDGRLIKTVPIGSVCHDPTYDEEQCNLVRSNWRNPALHEPHPSSIMDPIFLNKSCDPFDPRETPCEVGAYVQYAVNVSSPDHIVKTVQFVKNHNIRFVVKNTGHDYEGRSTGTGAVSVWMHNLQNIEFIPDFKGPSYAGPAFKASAGVLGIDLAREAGERGLVVVTGECPTVGFTGGYVQGGGHSALSSAYGLAADHTLEFEVITTQGEYVHASPTENQDLYWALSGGGGGTYGIVWSVTVRPHQDLPVVVGSVNFTSEGLDEEVFWKALDAYQASTPNITGAKIWAVASYSHMGFSLYPIFGVNKTAEEVSALLRPFLGALDELGVNYATGMESYNRYFDAYTSVGNFIDFEIANFIFGTRLLPRLLFEDSEKVKEVSKSVRSLLESGVVVFESVMRATLEVAGNPYNAVLPAWREAERHTYLTLPLVDGESEEQILKNQERVTRELVPVLRELSPDSGAYHNEADPNEPDIKRTFWGTNYDRLLAIKDKWDPEQILYGGITVGGDRWRQTEEGRLCRR
ncbi:FAD-binding domain-containing protein [Marasmius fiardii PR-910]|nr:FAD-binding domain-containing protein [Marasmius fiardii PR-910]